MHHKEFVKHHTEKINSRKRIVYKKANSKSDNPRLYVKCKDEYVAYGEYMKTRQSSKKKVSKGGGNVINLFNIEDHTDYNIDSKRVKILRILYNNYELKITYDDDTIEFVPYSDDKYQSYTINDVINPRRDKKNIKKIDFIYYDRE